MTLRNRKYSLWDYVVSMLFVLSALVLVCGMFLTKSPGDTDGAASRMERRVERRMRILDSCMADALSQKPDEWMELENIQPDMVVYRYVNDSLQSWANLFTVANDDISYRVMFLTLTNSRSTLVSPLYDIGTETSFVNLGQKWYLMKSVTQGGIRVIGGLEVMDQQDTRFFNSVNPRFRLSEKFSIKPLSFSGGSPVSIGGVPQFKVLYDSMESAAVSDVFLVWLSLLLFLLASVLLMSRRRTLRKFLLVTLSMFAAMAIMYFWGMKVQNNARIFSPILYADGPFFYSLGAIIITNLAIFTFILYSFLIRNELLRRISASRRSRLMMVIYMLVILSVFAGMVVYTHMAFVSIIRNSNICMELYRFSELSPYSVVVYVTFVSLLMSIILLLQMLRPAFRQLFGIRYDAFSMASRLLLSFSIGAYLVLVASVLGKEKELQRVEVWANRLSVDRDISLELQLRRVESSIAGDAIIASMSFLPNTGATILNRIVESYMYRLGQEYDISVTVFPDGDRDPAAARFFAERVNSATPVYDNSHFLYSTTPAGLARYTGVFTFYHETYGVSYVMLSVEPQWNKDNRGYSSLMDISAPGKVQLPANYSYARYKYERLITYRGNYAYPTLLADAHWEDRDGFQHFRSDISDDEVVIISRRKIAWMNYVIASMFVSLFAFLLFMLITYRRVRRKTAGSSYFKSRISTVLLVSLILTLVAMAAVSVIFVYNRNDANKQEMMSDRINSVQALMEPACRSARSLRDLTGQDMISFLENAGTMTKTDLTLYSPDGKAFRSTSPEVFDRMLISDRINPDAYYNIVYGHKRYFINQESIGGRRFYALYAPLFNDLGDMVAILSTPYTDQSYDFEMEAALHLVTILTMFLILLILARFMVVAIVDRMFQPLLVMGRKMSAADVDSLEYISYDNDDEIQSLVKAYNRMVHDLSESTRQLAQAERDKAWSSMARQVAHEIKNPLTPMKLQIQRLIRLKQRGAENWQDKFDEVAGIVLDHIDILTDTANEFSTFAKLYTEEPTAIDLDRILQEEISMFDNREEISFDYFGLAGTTVMGPKPQLTRVFVNLITNSVQAIENARADAVENGAEPQHGRILVSLRNSAQEGFYDIVFEDNGPGVREENQQKLFTPNFTTKSSGTGLGLAICRNILEKCNAQISYSRSFNLGGACFTIRYPKS